jgi:glycosyltransferase involved in cell wall biosynthesis
MGMVGTRGVPARYGGFETAIEEIGRRLVERGHEVTVYCRDPRDGSTMPERHLGMHLVTLPAVRSKAVETLSHTALSVAHEVIRRNEDVTFLFNSANSLFLPVLRLSKAPVAVHVDGLEWRRSKWSGAGKRYYRTAEALAVRWADALIADAAGIGDYYRDEFGATTELISYGAPVLDDVDDDRLAELGLEAGEFHLVVARFEPENHIELMVSGYRSSDAVLPLVVVGGAPYSDEYTRSVHAAAGADGRIRLLGPLWDQEQLNQLYAHARLYLHGHSVGGTNPSLLRAMGAGAPVGAYDVVFNREVLGDAGWFFDDAASVGRVVEAAERDPGECARRAKCSQQRIASHYQWDGVTDGYEQLARRLASGWTRRGECDGRRRDAPAWHDATTAGPAGSELR